MGTITQLFPKEGGSRSDFERGIEKKAGRHGKIADINAARERARERRRKTAFLATFRPSKHLEREFWLLKKEEQAAVAEAASLVRQLIGKNPHLFEGVESPDTRTDWLEYWKSTEHKKLRLTIWSAWATMKDEMGEEHAKRYEADYTVIDLAWRRKTAGLGRRSNWNLTLRQKEKVISFSSRLLRHWLRDINEAIARGQEVMWNFKPHPMYKGLR